MKINVVHSITIVCDCILIWLLYVFITYVATSYIGSNIIAEFHLVIYSKFVWQTFEDHQIVLHCRQDKLIKINYLVYTISLIVNTIFVQKKIYFNAIACNSGMCL